MQPLITDAPRRTTNLLLRLADIHRISVHRSLHLNKLHTTHNTMQMSTSDNSRHILLSQEASTATASLTHTLSLLSLCSSSLHLRRSKILDSSQHLP